MSFNEHVTLRGGEIAGHDVHGGGLAGAVGPQQAEDLAVLHRETQAVHRAAAAVELHKVFDLNHRKCPLVVVVFSVNQV